MYSLTTMIDAMFAGDYAGPSSGPRAVLLVLVLAFLLGHVVAWVYMWTHAGLSYSRMFTASLVVLPLLVSAFMMLVASNAFIALGMLAVFPMIRFRNVLQDTRDTMFILWTQVEGLAVGTQHFALGLLAAVAVGFAFLYLRATPFRSRNRYAVIAPMDGTDGGSPPPPLR